MGFTFKLNHEVHPLLAQSSSAAEGKLRLLKKGNSAGFLIHLPCVNGEGEMERKAAITKAEEGSAYLTNCMQVQRSAKRLFLGCVTSLHA